MKTGAPQAHPRSARPNRARRREDSGPLPGPGSRKGWRCASLPADPRSLTVESLSGEREMKVRLLFAFSGSGGTLLGSTRCLCCLAVQRAAAAGTFPLRLGLRVDSSGLSCLLRATLSPGRCPNAFLVRKMADTPRAAGHDGAGYGIRLVLACWARTTGGRVIASVPANMTWLVVCQLSLFLSLSPAPIPKAVASARQSPQPKKRMEAWGVRLLLRALRSA